MEKKRIVITGLGVISPVGIGTNTFWQSLLSGKSGVSKVESFDVANFSSKIAAQCLDYDPLNYFDTKKARTLARFVQYASVAAKEAVANANLNMDNEDRTRVGVIVGSGIGSIRTAEVEYEKFLKKGPRRISPHFIPRIIINEAAGQVSIDHGAQGPATCVVTACSTATNSIGEAARLIAWDEADVMIAGGTESATTVLGLGGFSALKALSTQFNDEPQRASRPFDAKRDGFVMGEGAGVCILESLEHAQKRGAKILAEFAGYGRTSDAYHITAPESSGNGAKRAMELAMKDGGLNPANISYINAHGTSTSLNDKTETLAIKNAFGENAAKIPISSTKSMTGHLLGAAGGVEFAACVKAVQDDIVPPTINYENPDPECDLDYVPNEARKITVNTAMSNSLGFGGHNASIIVKKFQN